MAHLDLGEAPARPVPVATDLQRRIAHIQQMLLAAAIASTTIIVVAAAMMTRL